MPFWPARLVPKYLGPEIGSGDGGARRRAGGAPGLAGARLAASSRLARSSSCAFGRAFTILKPNSGGLPVVYLDDIFDAHYIRSRDTVELFELLFEHLRSSALTDDKSTQLIQAEAGHIICRGDPAAARRRDQSHAAADVSLAWSGAPIC